MITNKTTTLRDHISAWRKCQDTKAEMDIHQAFFAGKIGHEITGLLKPIIPDIVWCVGNITVHLSSIVIEADRYNPKRQYSLQWFIEYYFPELCFIVETSPDLKLTAKEADRVIEALEKLRRREYLEGGDK
jgi:hypothetical protein